MGQQGNQEDNSEIRTFKCPNCGGEGFFEDHKVEWALAGKIRSAVTVGSNMTITQVVDKGVAVLSAPTVRAMEDICTDCGTRFVRELKLTDTPVQVIMPRGGNKGGLQL